MRGTCNRFVSIIWIKTIFGCTRKYVDQFFANFRMIFENGEPYRPTATLFNVIYHGMQFVFSCLILLEIHLSFIPHLTSDITSEIRFRVRFA